jgi:hypothetical protein
MPHYHIGVGDAAGAPKVPSVKPPKPKAPGAAPSVPSAKLPGIKAVAEGVGAAARAGTGLARRVESGVDRLSGFGEQWNRDDAGHLHFNVPSRGSRMQRDYGTSEGARKRSQHQVSAEQHTGRANRERAVGYGQTRASLAHTQAARAHTQAHAMMGKPGYAQAAAAAHAASRRAWGDSNSEASEVSGKTNLKTNKAGETIYPRDSGTSEGAKKAAQTRARGGSSPYQGKKPYWRGGEFDIKAGSNQKRAAPRRDPEPYRGYDSRRK